jgi:protein tyrosine/serine phosphatase
MNTKRALLVSAVAIVGMLTGGLYLVYQSFLPNLRVVRDGVLWRSGQPSRVGLHLAHWAGVRTIVCLREGADDGIQAEAAFAEHHGILFIQNPLLFSGKGIDTAVSRFMEVVGDARRQPVLVHCARGKERSGVCGAVFRMEFDGWTNAEALREMQALGFAEDTLPALRRYVATYRPQRRLAEWTSSRDLGDSPEGSALASAQRVVDPAHLY